MRISILQEKLSRGLSSVSRVVSNKPTLPILSNVLLSAKQGGLELFATDLNLGVRMWLGAKVKKAYLNLVLQKFESGTTVF